MAKILYATLLLLMSFTGCATASESALYYLVQQPRVKSAHPPVLILLHGFGSNEADLFSLADQLPQNFMVIAARGPYELGPSSYAWYHLDMSTPKTVYSEIEAEKSRMAIIQLVAQMKEKYRLIGSDIYLFGFSQGAIMSYSVGLTNPGILKGIGIMSGRLLDEVQTKAAAKDKLKQLKVFISHGSNDKVLDVHYARDANNYLKSLGLTAQYKEYPEPHTISRDMLHDFVGWLSAK